MPPALSNLVSWADITDASTVFSDDPPTTQAVNGDTVLYVTNKGTDVGNDWTYFEFDAAADIELETNMVNGLQGLTLNPQPAPTFGDTLTQDQAMPDPLNGATAAMICIPLGNSTGAFAGAFGAQGAVFTLDPLAGRFGGYCQADPPAMTLLNPWVADNVYWAYVQNDTNGDEQGQVAGETAVTRNINPYDSTGQRISIGVDNVKMLEVLYWDKKLDASEVSQFDNYCTTKYGAAMPFAV
jgi:hypothetical protein